MAKKKRISPFEPIDISKLYNDPTGLASSEAYLNKSGFDKRYSELTAKKNLDPFNAPSNLEKWGSQNQSFGSGLVNSVAGFGTQALAGILDGIATLDPTGYKDLWKGEEVKTNSLNEISKKLRNFAYDNLPIYNSGKTLSLDFLGNTASTIGYSVGMMTPSMAIAALINAASMGTGVGASALVAQRAFKTLNVLNMAISGVTEAKLNAIETYENAIQQYKEAGYSDEESEKMAVSAASKGFKREVLPLILFNSLQFGMFLKASKVGKLASDVNFGYSAMPELLFEKTLGRIKNPIARKATSALSAIIPEGTEEGIQTGISGYSINEQLRLKGDLRTQTASDAIFTDDFIDSAIIGGLSGLAFKGVASGFNRLSTNKGSEKIRKDLEQEYEQFFTDTGTRAADMINNFNAKQKAYEEAGLKYRENPTAENRIKYEKAVAELEQAQVNTELEATTRAIRLDNIMGSDKAYKAQIEQLEHILSILKSDNKEALQTLGVLDDNGKEIRKGQREDLIQYYEKVLEDSIRIGNRLNQITNTIVNDYGLATEIVKAEERERGLTKAYEEADKKLQEYLNEKTIERLSDKGHKLLNMKRELLYLESLKDLTKEQKRRKEALLKSIYDLEQDETYEAITEDEKIIRRSLKNNKTYMSLKTTADAFSLALEEATKYSEKVKSKEYLLNKIEEAKKEKEALKKAKKDKKLRDKAKKKTEKTQNEQNSKEDFKDIKNASSTDINDEVSQDTVEEVGTNAVIKQESNKEEIKSKPTEKPTENSTALNKILSKHTSPIQNSDEEVQNFGDSPDINDLNFEKDSKQQEVNQEEPQYSFTPREFNQYTVSEEEKVGIKENTESELKAIEKANNGRFATFEDFIAAQIRQFGEEAVENNFNGLVYAYQSTGREIVDANEVYRKFFKPSQAMQEVMSILQKEPTEVAKEIEQQENKNEPKEKDKISQFNSTETRPKAAFLGIPYKIVRDENGKLIKINISEELNESSQIPNHYVLDPKLIHEGTILEVTIPEDVNDIPVTHYYVNKDDYWERKTMSFGQWVKQNKVEVGSQEWYNKVPMVAILKGGDKVQDRVFFLHDTGWFNETNIGGNTNEEIMQNIMEGASQMEEVRTKIAQQLKEGITPQIRITERTFGQFFNKANNQSGEAATMALKDATGDTILLKSTTGSNLVDCDGITQSVKIKVINKKSYPTAGLLEARPINILADGTVEYVVLPTLNPDFTKGEALSKTASNNMKFAFIASNLINIEQAFKKGEISKYNYETAIKEITSKTGVTLEKAYAIKDAILKLNKIDITDNIGEYLSLFSFVTNKLSTFTDSLYNEKIPEGAVFINFENKVFKIYRKDEKTRQYLKNITDKAKTLGNAVNRLGNYVTGVNYNETGFNNNSIKNIVYLTLKLTENDEKGNNVFSYSKFNASYKFLGRKAPFIEIDENGNINTNEGIGDNGMPKAKKTYDDFLKETVKTTVKSFEIKDNKGNTKWITDIQPKIIFEVLDSEKDKKEKKEEEKTGKSIREAFSLKRNKSETKEETKTKPTTQQEKVEDKIESDTVKTLREELEKEGKLSKEEIEEILKIAEEAEHLDDYLDEDNYSYSVREFTEEENKELQELNSKKISKLSLIKQKKLVNNLFNRILNSIDLTSQKSVDFKIIVRQLSTILEDTIEPIIKELEGKINALETKTNSTSTNTLIIKFKKEIEQLQAILDEKNKIVGNGLVSKNNPEGIKGVLFNKLERFFSEDLTKSIEETEDIDIDNIDTDEKISILNTEEGGFGGSAFTKNHKLKFSEATKIFFSGIPKINKNTGQPITTFYNLIEYYSIDEAEREFMEILAFAESSEESVIKALEEKIKEDKKPIYKYLLDKFKNTTQDVRNSILYNMIKQPLEMQSVLYSTESNTTKMRVINANSGNSIVSLKLRWASNFMESPAYKQTKTDKIIDKDYLKNILNKILYIRANFKSRDVFSEFKEVLYDLGFDLEDSVLKELYNSNNPALPTLFDKDGLFTIFEGNIRQILNSQNPQDLSINNKESNPQENAKKVINKIAKYVNRISGSNISKSFRLAGKIVQGTTQRTALAETILRLKNTNSELFQSLLQIPYSSNNYILELLLNNEEFKSLYDMSYTSLQVLKDELNSINNNKKVAELSMSDSLIAQLAYFTQTIVDLKKPFSKSNINSSELNFRLAYTYIPTISDKDKMVLIHNPVISLSSENISFNELTQQLNLNDDVLDFITNQIYNSEFDRIVTAFDNKTKIKNFDFAATLFLSIPKLNYMVNSKGENIQDLFKAYYNDEEAIKKIKAEFFNIAKKSIKEYIEGEVKSKINLEDMTGSFFTSGILQEDKENTYSLNFIDDFYLKSKADSIQNFKGMSVFQKSQVVATEFVLSQILSQHSIYQLYVGDLANYGVKFNSKKHTKIENGEEVIDYISYLKDVGTNVLKRMAGCEAPGNTLSNSNGDSYLHIAIQDSESESDLLVDYIKQIYNNKLTKQQRTLLDDFENLSKEVSKLKEELDNTDFESEQEYLDKQKELSNKEYIKEGLLETLVDTFPDIEAYANLTRTDAQEYTTWQEHLDNIFRQGRLTEEEVSKFKEIQSKLERGEDLSNEEISMVLQPIKSVYAGTNIYGTEQPLFNRFVYIKSSSIPLLPQVTRGLKIDKVRQVMEQLQKVRFNNKTGKPYMVRMSYQSANKIGAINTNLTMNDLYYTPFDKLYDNGNGVLAQSITELDRNFFRVQLDVPHKTDKNLKLNKEDSITLGSQMWKVLMSNGINKIKSRIFPNIFDTSILEELNNNLIENDLEPIEISDKLSGEELDKIKTFVESKYIDHVKQLLYKDLYLNEKGEIQDLNETTKRLQKILKEETTIRQYSENVIDALELIDNEDGTKSFKVPLWLSSGSDKFEALLQAIISNRLITWSLPGNSYVVGSSEGFTFDKKTIDDLDSKTKSRIVWVDKDFNGTLRATRLENGELKESEVLLKPHFRINYKDSDGTLKTKLVDLLSDEYSYYDEATNRRYLKTIKDKDGNEIPIIEKELLTHFSFRTPTSSHQSGAILKVVGFLPPEVGDLMVVPAEHTAQLGEDYDIDKRNVYNSNYIVDRKTGKISKLTKQALKNKANTIVLSNEDIKSLKQDLYALYKENKIQKDLLSSLFKGEDIDLNNLEEDFKDEIIEALNSGDKNILKETIQRLHRELKEKDQFFKEDIQSDIDNLYETLFEKIFENLLKRNKKKLLENSIIDVYKSVFSSNSSEVQNIISKVLSFEKASEVVEVIKTASNNENNQSSNNFSIYSDDYQRQQMKLGRDGQLGVAIYSSLITLHAQLNRLKRPCLIKNSVMTIGKYTSKGYLGLNKTLDGTRLISDVLSELQNSAVDNIKAMVMGFRNENEHTMNVFGMMTLRGFDLAPFYSATLKNGQIITFNNQKELDAFINREDIKDEVVSTTHDIHYPSLFLSQPILKKYSELKDLASSEIGVKQSEDKILQQLLEEYTDFGSVEALKRADFDSINKELTPENLLQSIKSGDNTHNFREIQTAVLKLFIQLKEESEYLLQYQRMINLSSTKLGISYYDVLSRLEILEKLANNEKILGLQELVGIFTNMNNKPQDFVEFDNFSVKPTTPEGVVLVNSLKLAKDIMSSFFPYDSDTISTITNTIIKYTKALKDDITEFDKKRLQKKILQEFRNYINSFPESQLFTGDIKVNRFHLFFDYITDKTKSLSLGSFIKELKKGGNPIFNQNLFLKSLEINSSTSSLKPILIRSVIDESAIFESNDIYEDFLQLLQDDTTILGEWKGVQITPKRLAQFLATHSLLSNEEGGVYGFRKAIYLGYLDILGFNEFLRGVDTDIKSIDIETIEKYINFIPQFFQHNPQEAFQINANDLENLVFSQVNSKAQVFLNKEGFVIKEKLPNFVRNLESFSVNYERDNRKRIPKIVAFKDKTESNDKKYRLFIFNPKTSLYERVNLLGATGYSEYDETNSLPYSNIYKNSDRVYSNEDKFTINKSVAIEEETTVFDSMKDLVESRDSTIKAVDLAINFKTPEFKDIAENLSSFIDESVEIKIEELETSPGVYLKTGVYDNSTNTIYISPNIYNNLLEQFPNRDINKLVEEIVLEEFVHSIVNNALRRYGTMDNGVFTLNSNAPVALIRLMKLYENVLQNAEDTNQYYLKDIYEFVAGVFVDENFRNYLDTVKTKNGKTLLDTFKDLIAKIISYITTGSYSSEVKNAVADFLYEDFKIQYSQEMKEVSTKKPIESIETTEEKPLIPALEAKDKITTNTIETKEKVSKIDYTKDIVDLRGVNTFTKKDVDRISEAFNNGKILVFPTLDKVNTIENATNKMFLEATINEFLDTYPKEQIDIIESEDKIVVRKKQEPEIKNNIDSKGFDNLSFSKRELESQYKEVDVLDIAYNWLEGLGLIRKDKNDLYYRLDWSKKKGYNSLIEIRRDLQRRIESINNVLYDKYGIIINAEGNLFNIEFHRYFDKPQDDYRNEMTRLKNRGYYKLKVNMNYYNEFNKKYNEVRREQFNKEQKEAKIQKELEKIKKNPTQGTLNFGDSGTDVTINNCE